MRTAHSLPSTSRPHCDEWLCIFTHVEEQATTVNDLTPVPETQIKERPAAAFVSSDVLLRPTEADQFVAIEELTYSAE